MDIKFKKAILLSVVLVACLAVIDIWGFQSGLFKDYYKGLPGQEAWWPLYHNIALLLLVSLPICYYFLVKKDKSESFAIFLSSYILWQAGLEDVLYYWFQGIPIDKTLPWCNGMPIVHAVTTFFNEVDVTSTTLLASVIVGFIAVYFISKQLYELN